MARGPLWEPKNEVERTTIQKYRGKPRAWRMEEAVRLHLEEDVTQSEAARMCGVSRSKVNVRVKEAREALARQSERSEASRQERQELGEGTKPTQPLITETRRVPSLR